MSKPGGYLGAEFTGSSPVLASTMYMRKVIWYGKSLIS